VVEQPRYFVFPAAQSNMNSVGDTTWIAERASALGFSLCGVRHWTISDMPRLTNGWSAGTAVRWDT